MWVILQIILLINVYHSTLAVDNSCAFASECDCSKKYQNITVVECHNASTFPKFQPWNNSLNFVIVQGNFTKIPKKAFYNLHQINYGIVLKRTKEDKNVPIHIDPYAFNFYGPKPISLSFVNFGNLTKVPTEAFQNVTLSQLYFYAAGFVFLSSNDFSGLSAYMVQMEGCDLSGVDADAFTGLNILEPSGLTLDFNKNGMKEIPSCVQTSNIAILSLANNDIYSVPDYAFTCQKSPCEMQGSIREINLNGNPILIHEFGTNSFANLPNLTTLSLQSIPFITNISTILPFLEPVDSTLTYLDLEFNSIQTIPAYSFIGFDKLMFLNLNGNPISQIEVDAFSGLDSMTALILDNMVNLTSVDLLITQGMPKVQWLNLAYGAIENVTLSNPPNVPVTLQLVDCSNNNLITIDEAVGTWLNVSNGNALDISGNHQIDCTSSADIAWMANFVLCPPFQIRADDTLCQSGEALTNYLEPSKTAC